ncbi:MAG TPA: hypothetical protein VIL20_25280, partial [Sandaracinaceae bacterium]
VETNEGQLLDRQYFVFLKWAEDEDGAVRARWHLSPATDQVATRVRAALQQRADYTREESTHRRVIIHRN